MRVTCRVLALALSLVFSLFVARTARADADAGADAAAEPPIEPPRALSHAEPAYPEGETTKTTVIVEVVVDASGAPSDVRAIEGSEPFAGAAVSAVKGYRFEPARRAGKPIRARIRIAVDFTPPEPAKPEPIAPNASAGAGAGEIAKPAPIADEVTILGERNPVASPTQQRIGRAEVRMIPGAFGDPYRAIDILPGVVPIVSGLPYYFVRGAPPSAVGYFVEEVRVPYLFHFGLGPGVIQPALIEEVSLHPAAFPARYGRFAGGIIAGQLREPATELRGEAQIRVYDAGAYVESAFANG
ncbi:MAG: TonB family protein / TonB-dependent receptor, partial [Labilithrix sp.]|nr:TonB family protein / TonB-dependent receptor [Labilithrix sp.]